MGADAKIDLEKNIIEINCPPLPIYQTVIEKTRGLAIRTQALGAAMSRGGAGQQGQERGQGQQQERGQGGKGADVKNEVQAPAIAVN